LLFVAVTLSSFIVLHLAFGATPVRLNVTKGEATVCHERNKKVDGEKANYVECTLVNEIPNKLAKQIRRAINATLINDSNNIMMKRLCEWEEYPECYQLWSKK
jgi:hypothetical protein